MSIISGEKRIFGKCDVEIKNNKIEPAEHIKGNIARTYIYMSETYPRYINLSFIEQDLFNLWDKQDPVDKCLETKKTEHHHLHCNLIHF